MLPSRLHHGPAAVPASDFCRFGADDECCQVDSGVEPLSKPVVDVVAVAVKVAHEGEVSCIK